MDYLDDNIITITAQESAERIDALLARCVPELTRSAAARLIDDGAVTVGGKAVKIEFARRAVGELFRDEIHVMAAQKRFLAADDIKTAERSGLQIRFEAALSLGSGVVRLFFCHLLTP